MFDCLVRIYNLLTDVLNRENVEDEAVEEVLEQLEELIERASNVYDEIV